jgi:hypothetical protein
LGAIVGGVVAGFVGVALVVILVIFFWKRKKGNEKSDSVRLSGVDQFAADYAASFAQQSTSAIGSE